MVNRSFHFLAACAALVLLAQTGAAATARLSASQIYLYETVQLELSGAEEASPDLSSLEKDFEVQGSSSQRSMQITNGQIQVSEFTLKLTLRPLRAGVLQVPPIALGSERTNPLEIEVKAIDAATQQAINRKAFFEVDVSNETPYQGQAVFLTRRLFYAADVQIYGSLPGLPDIPGASVQPAGEPSASVSVVDGQRYNVYVSEYVLFADQPGELLIPAIEVMARLQVALRKGQRTLGVPIRADEAALEVRPPPAAYPVNKPWLPARNLTIASEFDATQSQVSTPLTFDVNMQVEDALASQLAPLDLAFPASIKAYPESPRLDDAIEHHRVRGQRLEKYSLVPTAPGIFTLPEVRVAWWDTHNERLRETILPAREIEILPDPSAPAPALPENAQAGRSADSPLAGATAPRANGFDALHSALALLCVLLALGWLVTLRPALIQRITQWRASDVEDTPESRAFDRLAYAQNLAESITALRAWLRHVRLEAELRAACDDFLRRGEASLYAQCDAQAAAPPTPGELRKLMQDLRDFRKAWRKRQARSRAPVLPDLYASPVKSPSGP